MVSADNDSPLFAFEDAPLPRGERVSRCGTSSRANETETETFILFRIFPVSFATCDISPSHMWAISHLGEIVEREKVMTRANRREMSRAQQES